MIRGDWNDDNARGLAFASVGAWNDAVDAFCVAADAVEPQESVAAHEALALVLNNLAQACFRAHRIDEGIQYAQRACSLRVALVGEDALSVARARADLAVMLGTAGRAQEALQLIDRAIASIDRQVGDEDLRLATVLENAARLSMAAAQPSSAEPYLLRLHALLAAHDQSTDIADALLARVASFRAGYRDVPAALTPVRGADVITADVITADVITADVITADVAPEDVIDASAELAPDDDEPLREAVELTDVLLRATPVHVRAIEIDTPIAIVRETPVVNEVVPALEFIDDSLAPIDELMVAELEPAADQAPAFELSMIELAPLDSAVPALDDIEPRISPDDIFGNTTLELIDDPLSAASSYTPPSSASAPAAPRARADVLGFHIEYGTPNEDALNALADSIVAPPTSVRVQTPSDDAVSFAIMPPAPVSTQIATPQVNASSATPPAPSFAPPMQRGMPSVVMPSPARGQRAIDATTTEGSEPVPRLTVQNSDDLARDRSRKLRAGRASAPRSQTGLLIAAGVTATMSAVAAWMAFGPR